MRLDDFDPNINVGEEENQGGGFGLGGGGGGLLLGLLPLIGSRFGCGGIAVVLLLLAVFGGGMGGLGHLMGSGGQVGAPATRPASGTDAKSVSQICDENAARHTACNAFSSADKTWAALFAKQGQTFRQPGLIFYDRNAPSGCGAAQSAMGPFYCPADQRIYLDTSFFDELQTRFGAKGDFAQDYVIAHEFGHHIQNLLGVSDKVAQVQRSGDETQGNAASVRLELQADCYAGVWAAQNRDRLDPGDVQGGLTAAHAIGDDTSQEEAGRRPMPDSFTHGTSAQRMHWLKVGIDSGDPAKCDTFGGGV